MPRLKKRLPESRSEKRERLASESALNQRQKELARARQRQLQADAHQRNALLREWRTAVENRLTSEAAYARFEMVHARDWNLIRPYWEPDVDVSLTLQRLADGREADPEPLIAWLESDPNDPIAALHLLKRARFTHIQRARLQALVLRKLAATERLPNFRFWWRLARKLYAPEFHDRVAALSGERAARVLAHLDQQRTMNEQ